MKKLFFGLFLIWILIIVGLIGVVVENEFDKKKNLSLHKANLSNLAVIKSNNYPKFDQKDNINRKIFKFPLDQAKERVTKKPFGIYITLQNSPVLPERFEGYHTGVDFEVFEEELDKKVEVKAVCTGDLVVKRQATGYGGVAVQSCILEDEPIMVIYGHLQLSSIAFNVGDDIEAGRVLGHLGAAESVETDGERKHLHLAFRKGEKVNLLGYVKNERDLSSWIDPCLYVCQ